MTSEELISHARRLRDLLKEHQDDLGMYAQACEFLRTYAGTKSSFLNLALANSNINEFARSKETADILESFAQYVETGLHGAVSPERKAQLDVVSDLLDQANAILRDSKLHPAAAAVLIGATLEEFLRTWVEKEALSLGNRKPCLNTYTDVLYTSDLISKQDVKNLTAWGGIRNDAAHGNWKAVESQETITLMLQGVNLFLQQNQSK